MRRPLLLVALAAGCATGTVSPTAAPSPDPTITPRLTSPHECAPLLCQILPAPPTSASPTPRATPTRASRSRLTHTTGTLTDTTCYAATGNRTASGKWPRVGMAASNRYPFGTRLRVTGVGVVTVEDRIGHGSSLDIFGPSEWYCRHFGRQHLRVQVIR